MSKSFVRFLFLVSVPCLLMGFSAGSAEPTPPKKHLVPPSNDWTYNDYCKLKKYKNGTFFISSPYSFHWANEDKIKIMKSVGFYDMVIPGGYFRIENFDPELWKKKPNDPWVKMAKRLKKNGWPVDSVGYHAAKEDAPKYTKAAIENVGDLWIGDGHGEYCYRFERILSACRKEKSSYLHLFYEKGLNGYYQKYATPLIKKELPHFWDKNHKWTHRDYSILRKIICEVTFREIGLENAAGYAPWVPYYSLPKGGRSVATKHIEFGHKLAILRGIMRQFGGNKTLMARSGYEPTMALSKHRLSNRMGNGSQEIAANTFRQARLYVFSPFLSGATVMRMEGCLIDEFHDVENDGHYELSSRGHLYKELDDLAKRHPDRGITCSPLAFMMDWDRDQPNERLTTFGKRMLPFDDADNAVFELFKITGKLQSWYDLIKPNVPETGVDPKVFENYKALFALPGLKINKDMEGKLKDYVSKGGILILNVADAKNFPVDFIGAKITDKSKPAKRTISLLDNKVFDDEPYNLVQIIPSDSEIMYKTDDGSPVITRHKYGKGYVILCAAENWLTKDKIHKKHLDGVYRKWKGILSFTQDLLMNLLDCITPIKVKIEDDGRMDLIKYSVAKKGKGWVITLMNFSPERSKGVPGRKGRLPALYPFVEKSITIECPFVIKDAMEWLEDKDVLWTVEGDKSIIKVKIPSYSIKVIEVQPEKIKQTPVKRFVNYALNKPVTVSSEYKKYPAKFLVDGSLKRIDSWWSGHGKGKLKKKFPLPQWAQVDLGEVKTINHVWVLLYHMDWEMNQYQFYYYVRFIIEASKDGKEWQTVMDESKSIKRPLGLPLERYFDPIEARYVRIKVLENSIDAGARIIELKVFGDESEMVIPKRKKAYKVINKASSGLPIIDVGKDYPDKKITPLLSLPRVKGKVGWLGGNNLTIDYYCGETFLSSGKTLTKDLPNSIWAHAPSELVYNLGGKYSLFSAVIGFTKPDEFRGSTVKFKVFGDGKEIYNSGLFRFGRVPEAIEVDVKGVNELKLVVDDTGDGWGYDAAIWADAKLIE